MQVRLEFLWVNPGCRVRATSWIEQYANVFDNLPPLGKPDSPNGLNHQPNKSNGWIRSGLNLKLDQLLRQTNRLNCQDFK